MDRYMQVLYGDPVAQAIRTLVAMEKFKVFTVCAGGGAGLSQWLSSIPGSAGLFVGSVFPYATHETDRFLGFKTEKYVSRENAIDLAMASYLRSVEHLHRQKQEGKDVSKEPVGLAITAAVATSRELNGGYRAHVAVVTRERTLYARYELEPGTGEAMRHKHSRVCDVLGIDALLHVAGRPQLGDPMRFDEVPEEELRERFFRHPLFAPYDRRETFLAMPASQAVLLCGTFNPLHDGHRGMASTIEFQTGKTVVYSTTADSLHKPPLKVTELLDRAARAKIDHWEGRRHPILFTRNDPLFIDKARLYPGISFAIGLDTMERMLDAKWYGNGIDGLCATLAEIKRLGCRFYVFGRLIGESYRGVNDISLPGFLSDYNDMFQGLPGRWDISSTQLRTQSAMLHRPLDDPPSP